MKERESNNQIKKTKSYDQFNILKFNRPLKKSQLRNLTNSIKKNNMLHLHPIIVDSDMNVIDGQHRLEVASELKASIYYLVDDNVDMDHIMESNAAQKAWTTDDVIRFYAEYKKIDDYILLSKYKHMTGVSTRAVLSISDGCHMGPQVNGEFARGQWCFTNPRESLEMCVDYWIEIRDMISDNGLPLMAMFRYGTACLALHDMFLHPDYDNQRMVRILNKSWARMIHFSKKLDWLRQFVELYNLGFRATRIELDELM